MKKIFKLLIVSLLVFTCACSKQEEVDEPSMSTIPNPMVEYDSLSEINEKIGCNLTQPAVMGVTDEAFFVISDSIAQYDFSLNGYEYTFRASKDLESDISGIYVGNSTLFGLFNTTDTVNITGDNVKGYRFFTDDMQYTITVDEADALDETQFVNICEELETIVRD